MKLNDLLDELSSVSPDPESELDTILKIEFSSSLVNARAFGIPEDVFPRLKRIVRERVQSGKPVQYILERALFWSMEFIVNENVLIPRIETELLVDKTIEIVKKHGARDILDVGTGSGIIAITLKKELNKVNVFATDISMKALDVARRNAEIHGVDINLIQCNLLSCFKETAFDIIVSNPPYVGQSDPFEKYRRFEPPIALYGGVKGYELSLKLIKQALNRLKKHGYVIMEINPFNYEELVRLIDLPYKIYKDFNGLERIIVIEKWTT